MNRRLLQTLLMALVAMTANAQLSSNPDKFLGNITTEYNIDYGNEKFYQLWNEITPENETKWASVEYTRNSYNWGNIDRINNYAKQHGFPFKFHTLVWGSQFPDWVKNLSVEERYKAIVKWMDAVRQRYPNLEMIDVVNEAVEGHQQDTHYIKEALGGGGKTGYDWIIKAFEMAYERWPNAILIYNDFNTFRWNTDQFIDLVRTIRDAGAPIDAYGCQSHELTDCSESEFKSSMDKIQKELKIPMYITEYDIGTDDNNLQKQRYMEQIPYMWEADYCAGITLWGYIYGKTWTTNGNSGIIKNGEDRPAMTWLRSYMKSDKAKTAKSPFPGMKKEASVYVRPASLTATIGEPMPITIDARLKTKQIATVKLYVKGLLYATLSEAPYTAEYTPSTTGKHNLRAVVEATDGTKYERLSSFTAYKPRTPFKDAIELPGTIEAEDFDNGGEGVSYHESDNTNEGTNAYRSNGGGVDIVGGNGGYAIGYTAYGEWLEYTVDVKQAGKYGFEAFASSGLDGSSFSLSLNTDNGLIALTDAVTVPNNGDWNTYSTITGRLLIPLEEGRQIIRLNISGGYCNIDKIVFKNLTGDINEDGLVNIVDVTTLIDMILNAGKGNLPTTLANHNPYMGGTELPGTLEFENFDGGGEGVSFHDQDNKNEGTSEYRNDGAGVDIVGAPNGYGLGYTIRDEWLDYTVDVKKAGNYSFEAVVASGLSNSSFSLSLNTGSKLIALTDEIVVPSAGENDWNTYSTVKGKLLIPLEAGRQVIRLNILGSYCNLDKITFKHEGGANGDLNGDGEVNIVDVTILIDIILNR